MGDVTKLRLTAPRLEAAIQHAAAKSSNVVFVPPLEKRSMAGMMNFHQILLCLQEGKIVGKPKKTEHGDWEVVMSRSPELGDHQSIKATAKCDGLKVVRIFVRTEEHR